MKLEESLERMRGLYREYFGAEAPKIPESGLLPLPPGVDPRGYIEAEVRHLAGVLEKWSNAPWPGSWQPRADTFADDDAYVVEVETPGAKREEIEVMVTDGECVVRGERRSSERPLHPLISERPSGRFERRFPLPMGVRNDSVEAHYLDGILELRFPLETKRPIDRKTVPVH
jgi:HSP20 family molecular chaperone IbpA